MLPPQGRCGGGTSAQQSCNATRGEFVRPCARENYPGPEALARQILKGLSAEFRFGQSLGYDPAGSAKRRQRDAAPLVRVKSPGAPTPQIRKRHEGPPGPLFGEISNRAEGCIAA